MVNWIFIFIISFQNIRVISQLILMNSLNRRIFNFNGILIKPYDIHSFELKLINLSQNLKKLKFLRKNCKKSINILHDKKNITLMINRFIENVR